MALWEAVIDGAARGQGAGTVPGLGQGAVGVVIARNKKTVWGFARGLGLVTNNQAEYEALIAALMLCWAADDIDDPIIYSDSQVVTMQVNGLWRCKNPTLQPLLLSVQQIKADYRFRLQHVQRHIVSAADALANDFLDQLEVVSKPKSRNTKLPPPPIS